MMTDYTLSRVDRPRELESALDQRVYGKAILNGQFKSGGTVSIAHTSTRNPEKGLEPSEN